MIWVPKDSTLDLRPGLQALLAPSLKKIAMANPQHYEKVKDKFVLGENISQTALFVVSGSADVGIVALSLALSRHMKDKGRYAEVPAGRIPTN